MYKTIHNNILIFCLLLFFVKIELFDLSSFFAPTFKNCTQILKDLLTHHFPKGPKCPRKNVQIQLRAFKDIKGLTFSPPLPLNPE